MFIFSWRVIRHNFMTRSSILFGRGLEQLRGGDSTPANHGESSTYVALMILIYVMYWRVEP